MTDEDVKAILGIMLTADGGCDHCAAKLFQQFLKRYPHWREVANQVWLIENSKDYGWEKY